MNKSQRASETQSNKTSKSIKKNLPSSVRQLVTDFTANRNGGLLEMKNRILGLKTYLSDPTKRPSPRVVKFVNLAIAQYELAVKASIGMPTYSDSVTLQYEAPKDVPTVPLDGYQLVQRTCYVPKLASSGTTAGGFYADLKSSDMAPFVGTQKYFRIKKVTSWTCPRANGNANEACFAGVSVPVSDGNPAGTEVLPIWSENWTPIGQGFAGIVTQYPLGDFPQVQTGGTDSIILSHFTALGGTGGVTGVPVVFHVEIECLI
jgi:hypothetical protein